MTPQLRAQYSPEQKREFILERRAPKITQAPPPISPDGNAVRDELLAGLYREARKTNAEQRAALTATLNALDGEALDAEFDLEVGRMWREDGLMLQPADFAYWTNRDGWKLYEVAHLLHGFEPVRWDDFEPTDRDNTPRGCDRQKAADMYDRIKEAVVAKLLEARALRHPDGNIYIGHKRVDPAAVVAWARGKGFTIPGPIDAAFPAVASKPPTKVAPQEEIPKPEAPQGKGHQLSAAEEDRLVALFTPRSPGPEPKHYKGWKELRDLFSDILDGNGDPIPWDKITSRLDRKNIRYVKHEKTGRGPDKGNRFQFEGIALWLHFEMGADLQDVARCLWVFFRTKGTPYQDKADYWRRVSEGEPL